MHNWTVLADQVNAFLTQSAIYPDAITIDLRNELSQFDLLVMERLELFLRLPLSDAEKEERLRRFFAMRWTAVVNTSLDYTFNPNSPANQSCLLVATQIRKDDEAICSILMPTVTEILGSVFPDNLKDASEDLDDHLILPHFMTNESGSALIALEDLLNRICVNPDLFFSTRHDACDNDEQPVVSVDLHLTAEDRQRVRDVCGEIGKPYFDALEKMHRVVNGECPTVGHALQTLIRQLLRSSVIANGTDAHAKFAECYRPISTFYHIWFDLPESIRKQIAEYLPAHAHDKKYSLESQLLCLFNASCMHLSDAERARVSEEGNIECAHQIGLILHGIVGFYLEVLTQIPLPGKEKEYECEILPDRNELSVYGERCKNALSHRGAFLGVRDEVIAANALFFDTLTEHAFDPTLLDTEITVLFQQISSIQDFTLVLLLSPPEQWKKIILKMGSCMGAILAPDDKSWDALSFILKQLPTQHWKTFCDALCELPYVENIIRAHDLGILLQEFSEKDLIVLSTALATLSCYVLTGCHDVVVLFSSALSFQWTQQYRLFQSSIKAVIKDPVALAHVFRSVERTDWCQLVSVLYDIFTIQLPQGKFFTQALSVLNDYDKLLFVEAVVSVFGDTAIMQNPIMDMVGGVGLVRSADLFACLGSAQLTKWIPNEAALSTLLETIKSPAHRFVFVCAFANTPLNFQIDPPEFYALIKRFPGYQVVLMESFCKQLPRVLQKLISTLETMRAYAQKVPEKFYDHFQFYLETALPILFSAEALEKLVSRLKRVTIIPALSAIEKKMADKTLTPLAGAFERIEVLYCFLQQNALRRERDHDAEILARSILSVFREEFFQDVLRYKNMDFVALRAQCCAHTVTTTNTSTQASNQGFFSSNSRISISSGAARSALSTPPSLPPSLQDVLRNASLGNTRRLRR